LKYGTWNVRGLNGKEVELVKEIKKTDIKFLAINETKKKGQGWEILDDEYKLLYIGVSQKENARAGVGCLIHKDQEKNIINWKLINERIMQVDIKEEVGNISMIIVYGPNEDEKKEEKEEFMTFYKEQQMKQKKK
jgi:exonuclease III